MKLHINGAERDIDGSPEMPLLWALRDLAGLPGTKFGCGKALCGACTVHLDGQATRSCVTPISSVGAAAIVTIESIGDDPVGKKLQAAWVELDVPQCGYCQAGQIMAATELLTKNPHPNDDDIDAAMAGNICRCATYLRIRAAIKKAASQRSATKED